MLRRIKYRLLLWLLGDICERSGCNECAMCRNVRVGDWTEHGCFENDVVRQACIVWDLEE